MVPDWFKEYLSFHKSERNAIIVLIVFLIGLIGFNMCQRLFYKDDWQEVRLKFGPQILAFVEKTDSLEEKEDDHKPWIPETRELFAFDPNTLDSIGWVALGFSPKQAASIINYRNAGAIFLKPEDLKKLFVVDDERYEELKPYVEIQELPEESPKFETPPKWQKPKYEPIVVELNSADSTELVKLKGIGPSYSKRIIKYRDMLGGYVSKEQLLEVYGMDSARFLPILESLQLDTTIRQRININTAEAKELAHHPYIDWNQAKAIANYRKQHGNYTDLNQIKKIHLINEEVFGRLKPYLTVE
ncbi:MAG: hypothetical protein GC178_08485 [Flavobacteriales bacterium]|nr:hypothetical protein [Flavobacteriales bacterium]